MPTGKQIRREIARKRFELAWASKSTGAGTTSTLIDSRLRGRGLSASHFGDAWVRITGGTTENGHVAKVDYLDPSTGTLNFDPPAPGAVASGVEYEVCMFGIRPDHMDAARDRALRDRCNIGRPKPLSVVSDCQTWTNQVGSTTLAEQTLDYPYEWFDRSLLVSAADLNEGVESESYYVQPQQRLHLFGFASVRAQGLVPKLRQVNGGGADLTLEGPSSPTLTLRGWQTFSYRAQVPAGCEEVRARFLSDGASGQFELAGVGLLTEHGSRFVLPARVKALEEIGEVLRCKFSDQITPDEVLPLPVSGVKRRQTGTGVLLEFGDAPGVYPTYYEEKHRYAALQTDYLTASDRTTGDAASTDCELQLVEAATVVELLENMREHPVLNRIYLAAVKDLDAMALRYAMPEAVHEEPRRRSLLQYRL